MSPSSNEYCPIKSAACKAWRSPYTWVLASFVLGVLLMAAVGKDNDIQKAMWFATGTAITAVATAYQTYQSNKRAADEREFSALQNSAQRNHENEKLRYENTMKLRVGAYRAFLQACTNSIDAHFEINIYHKVLESFSMVRLVGDENITEKCGEMLEHILAANKIFSTDNIGQDKIAHQLSIIGALIREITILMRDDIGSSAVCLQSSSRHSSSGGS